MLCLAAVLICSPAPRVSAIAISERRWNARSLLGNRARGQWCAPKNRCLRLGCPNLWILFLQNVVACPTQVDNTAPVGTRCAFILAASIDPVTNPSSGIHILDMPGFHRTFAS